MTVPDRIEKTITLQAPLARVWAALTDSRQFGAWFGCALEGPFVAGEVLHGTIQPTQVDPEVAALQVPHAGAPLTLTVEAIEPMQRFAFRWRPYPPEPGEDPASIPTTLVTFSLRETSPGVTALTVTEAGFDRVPLARRARAFTDNDGGWAHQCALIEKYLRGLTA